MMREKGDFRMLNEIGMAAFEESVRSQIEEERNLRSESWRSLMWQMQGVRFSQSAKDKGLERTGSPNSYGAPTF